jgi:hypothetical protein
MPVIPTSTALYKHLTTAKKLMERALRLIGAIGVGEELEAAEVADALEGLNAMLDAWNAEELSIYAYQREAWTLIVNQQEYEIGPGGSMDTARPPSIPQGTAFIEDTSQSPTVEYELRVYDNVSEWGREMQKNSSAIQPYALYYEPKWPLGLIHLYPKPDAADNLVLYTPIQFLQLTSGIQPVSLPPGYAEAIAFNLALRIAPEYNRSVSAEVAAGAASALATIKMKNVRPAVMRCDDAIVGPGVYDINLGGFH